MSNYTVVGEAEEIPEGVTKVFIVDDVRVAICRVEGEYYAIEDVCTHDDAPLGEGCLAGHEIECPRHGARFDVRDGHVTRMPAVAPVETFSVKVEDGKILVNVEES